MRHVLVTTLHRGVFAGYLESEDDKTVVLTQARCGIRWNTTGGFLELAEKGPNKESKIGSVSPRLKLHDVTSISDCTEVATKNWLEHKE